MNNNSIKELLYRINVNSSYDSELLSNAFDEILHMENVNVRNIMLGSLLTAIMAKGPTEDDVVALLNTAFKMDNYDPRNRERVQFDGKKVITLVGSGKKGIKTINISTASALLAASLGAYVVKSGSSSTSSMTGSADFMQLVGVNLDISKEKGIEILKKCGFSFFKIENIIPKFDSVYGGNFYVPHALSFGLSALICPVQTDIVLYGLSHPNIELSLNVLKRFMIKNAMVISSTDDDLHFIDEVGIFGKTRMIKSEDGIKSNELITFDSKKELNLPEYVYGDIQQGKSKAENIKYILEVLNGTGQRAHEDIICVNCANILCLSGIVSNITEGYILSKKAIKTGQALNKLEEYIELTGGKSNIKELMRR